MVWAGEGIDLVDAVLPAAKVVTRITEQAEQCIARVSGLCRPSTRE